MVRSRRIYSMKYVVDEKSDTRKKQFIDFTFDLNFD